MTQLGRNSRTPRGKRVPRIASTTVAIRSALTLSAAVLALSGMGAAYAGTCATDASAATPTVSCNGVFTDTVNNSIDPAEIVTDLTLVLGDQAPTSVTPPVFSVGVYGNWDGAVGITNQADIVTNDAYDVLAFGDTVTVDNQGSMVAGEVYTYYAKAVRVLAQDNAKVDNSGMIYAFSAYGGATSLDEAAYGSVFLDNQAGGTIYAAAGGNTTGASLFADFGDADVDNAGTIAANGNGTAEGLYLRGPAGVALDNTGLIYAHSSYGYATAADLRVFDGELYVDNAGTLSASSGYRAVALDTFNGGYGGLSIRNSGYISAVSPNYISQGVHAYAHGDVEFYNSASGSISAVNGGTAQAVRLDSRDGGVDFDNDGVIYARGGYFNYRSFGVLVAGRGSEYLDNSGTITTVTSNGAAFGLYAFESKSGALVDFHNSGEIDARSYSSDATGVSLLAITSNATIDAVNDGTITATSYGGYANATGMQANGRYGGNDVIASNGAYGEIVARGSHATGISANSFNGDVGVTNDGSILANGFYHAVGAYAFASGAYGDAALLNSGSIVAASFYGVAYGAQLFAFHGAASLYNAVDGSISATSAYSYAVGAEVDGYNASAVNYGTITAAGNPGATGLHVGATYGVAELDNSGSIAAVGNRAYGAYVRGNYAATLDNSGVITASGDYGATGGKAIAFGLITVSNSGTIDASSFASTRGVITVGGDVDLYNIGEISASAYSGAARAIQLLADGTVDVDNYGMVEADSVFGVAQGIYVSDPAAYAHALVDNSGSISASSRYSIAYGVFARVANGSAGLDNEAEGTITASSYWSTAVAAESYGQEASASNHGIIDAVSNYGFAHGAMVEATDLTAGLRNSGSITATGYIAAGVEVFGMHGSANLINSGTIEADGTFSATGAAVMAANGVVIANNFGTIEASADGSASGTVYGLYASGGYYALAYNDGDISASSLSGDAVALRLNGYGSSEVDNDGHVQASSVSGAARGIYVSDRSYYAQISVDHSGDVLASSTDSLASGVFVKVYHQGDAEIVSSGDISAHGGTSSNGILGYAFNGADISVTTTGGEILAEAGSGSGRGIFARSLGSGDVTVANGADIDASSNSYAQGLSVRSVSGDASASNSGSIEATAGTQADGILAISTSGDVYALNTGEIVATGGVFAQGMHLRNVNGDTQAVNHGDISVYGGVQSANGIFVIGTGTSDIDVINDGDVLASGDVYAQALNLQASYGDIAVANAGNLTADADADDAMGIRARITHAGDVTIGNEGSVIANSATTDARGVYAYTLLGDISVDNGGDIYASADVLAIGLDLHATGDILVDNSGSIHATGSSTAWGIEVVTVDAGDVAIISSGSIDAQAIDRNAVGVHSSGLAGDFQLYNDGTLTAASVHGDALGVYVGLGTDNSLASVSNGGTIEASSEFANATGILLEGGWDYDLLAIDSDGAISAEAYHARATGVYANAYGYQGQAFVDIGDEGSIHAASGYLAQGVVAVAGQYVELTNAGEIDAVASNEVHLYAYAAGALASTDYGQALIGNVGSISALAEGLASRSFGATVSGNGANVTLANAGTISATAHGEHAAGASGAIAESVLLSALVDNSGKIQALASADLADALGVFAHASESATIHTAAGSAIQASALGDTDADATGAFALGLFANVYGDGAISALASANLVDGDARAYGAHAYGNFTGIYVLGDGSAVASAQGAYALAVGALQDGYFTAFRNEGTIEASANGDSGAAIGAMTLSGYGVHLYNEGAITANAHGEEVLAAGLFASSHYGALQLDNAGSISASGDSLAVAVQLRTDDTTHIENSGTLDAQVAIYTSGLSLDEFHNTGLITGAIWSGAGDDHLLNDADGVWNAGYISDFGTGDDHISNLGAISLAGAGLMLGAGNDAIDNDGTFTLAGSLMDLGEGDDRISNNNTVNLVGSTIDFGPDDSDGNVFYNYGLLRVRGHSQIDMGGGATAMLVPALDPNTFYNDGVIDFQDGVADDVLVITGDFDGDGDLNVDVSGLQGASDLLYIDGDVASGSVTTINVDVLDMPAGLEALVPMVKVSGDWVADNFVLGEVDLPFDAAHSFVTLDVGLAATADTLSLDFEVTGLTDAGTLATTVAPAVQGLVDSQVGTWRQRTGLIDRLTDGAVALWARVFQDRGSLTPGHASNFGNGGNFDWRQDNAGIEAGVDFSVTDELSLGLLLGNAKADIDLRNGGHGSSDIDADSWGLYGTWISPTGFYLDASYRRMSFDVDMKSVAGAMSADGDAEAFNLETGYAWTLSGGLKIEPQLQYTRTNVDKLDVLETSSGMTFHNEGGDSSRGRLGVALRKSFGEADAGWQWTPYATVSAVREFDGKAQYDINDIFHGQTSLEGTSTLLELGFTAQHQNWSVFGGLNWQDGGAVDRFFGGEVGVRYVFGGPTEH
jgi:outer membrane autotransporter protein